MYKSVETGGEISKRYTRETLSRHGGELSDSIQAINLGRGGREKYTILKCIKARVLKNSWKSKQV